MNPAVSNSKTRAYSVKRPNYFIKYKSTLYDWCNPSGADNWNGTGKKSIYDPCPAGWRVPNKNVWKGFTKATFVLNDAKGRYYNNTWYPASGYRYMDGSAIDDVGKYGYCWSASPSLSSESSGTCLYFSLGEVNSAQDRNRGFGYSVRCSKEQ